jgi:hypothetical protein
LKFPKRIYTEEEVKQAKSFIDEGYKHRIGIIGSSKFEQSVKDALELIRIVGCYDFLRTYIRNIKEIDGLTQLRQADAAIWVNKYAMENHVDAASVLVQKANHMKEYLEGKLYYGGQAEKRSDEKRIEFLEILKKKSSNGKIRDECERLLKMWHESSLIY